MLDSTDFAGIGALFAVAIFILYVLLRPRQPRHPVEIGKDLEEQVRSMLSQLGLTYEDRRKSSVTATPDFLVRLPSGKIGLEVKNVSELSGLLSVQNEKIIQGCRSLDALPVYVVGRNLNYGERQGIPVVPIHSLVSVLMLLGKVGPSLEFKDEFGVRQSVDELLLFEGRFRNLFDKLRKVRDAFGA